MLKWFTMFAHYSDNLSSNPAKAYIFSEFFLFEKNKNKQKEAGNGQFKQLFRCQKSYVDLQTVFLNCTIENKDKTEREVKNLSKLNKPAVSSVLCFVNRTKYFFFFVHKWDRSSECFCKRGFVNLIS